ncbi:MAG: Glu-tRNA(Gln) amidotransferase subunit GatD, partial [Candidatus Bathyarchaeota archaeon]
MYRGKAIKLLMAAGVEIGDTIQVSKNTHTYEGILIPRSEIYDDRHIVIKMRSGYNIGISINEKTTITKVGKGQKPTFSRSASAREKRDLPKVAVLSTGGTIASRVDYQTGGVRPALSADELYSIVPELSEIADISTEVVFSLLSEDIKPTHWTTITEKIARHVEEGVEGIIVPHGTDTMGYTAAALSFTLRNLPIPVILVGSQRSSDRPSSDAPSNLVGAVSAAAHAPFAEVAVAMHESVDDDGVIFHRGTKVRKCHTSRRDAFASVNADPIARFKNGNITMLTKQYSKRDKRNQLITKTKFSEDVALLKFHPGFKAEA